MLVRLEYTNLARMAPKCFRVQRGARLFFFFFLPNRKGGYCNRNISFILFTLYRLESRSSSPLQTGAKDRGWKWSSSMIPSLPSRSSGASSSFYQFGKWIKIYSLCWFLATLHFIDYLDHPSDTKVLNDPACVLDFPTNCVTAVSLTAGTEKPFSSCRLWYRRRPVGWQLLQLLLLILSCRNESLSSCFPRLSHLIHMQKHTAGDLTAVCLCSGSRTAVLTFTLPSKCSS